MKIYKIMIFRSNGWNEWHDEVGVFTSREKALRQAQRMGFDIQENVDPCWSSHIAEEEID